MDDNNDATTQAAVREEFVSPRRSGKGRQLEQPSSTSSLIGAGLCDAITFLKRIFCLYTVLFVFFPRVFLSALSISVLPTKIAEAGTKGEMSYLDAPDA